MKKVLFLILLTLLSTTAQAEKYALIVAVGDYPESSGWADISSVNDASFQLNNLRNSSRVFFINQEDRIASTPIDNFAPNLSTMINFYSIIEDNFKIDRNSGLSIPISANINGVHFLLGPSVFFENTNRFSFKEGIVFNPMQQLTNVWDGDLAISSDLKGFREGVYDVSYYFGISFSLIDLN